jgi:hypothetical protein
MLVLDIKVRNPIIRVRTIFSENCSILAIYVSLLASFAMIVITGPIEGTSKFLRRQIMSSMFLPSKAPRD